MATSRKYVVSWQVQRRKKPCDNGTFLYAHMKLLLRQHAQQQFQYQQHPQANQGSQQSPAMPQTMQGMTNVPMRMSVSTPVCYILDLVATS